MITAIAVSLLSSSFLTDPPTFTLVGDTSGGPPVTRTWSRDGVEITANAAYSISIAVNGNTRVAYQETRYRSTLTVRGRLPGLYQYSVTNRAMSSTMMTSSIRIEG